MESCGSNSVPDFHHAAVPGKDAHLNNVSVHGSKLTPPSSWNEFSVYSKELPDGATLEHYKILKVLGSGGFGITYLVRDLMLKRKVFEYCCSLVTNSSFAGNDTILGNSVQSKGFV